MTLNHKEKIQHFADCLRQANIPHESLFVFGSVAKGKDNPWSDIDIAVVGPAFGVDRIEEMVTLRMIAQPIDPAISPISLRPEDLDDKFSTIGQAVRKEGRLIE